MAMSRPDTGSSSPPNAKRLRVLLGQADITEEAAAIVLDVDEADIRAYVAGKQSVPRYVILAVERIVNMRMDGR
jgi:hypothetical protein